MTDVKLFLKRSAIAAVSLALIVPGLAFFSLAEEDEQPAEQDGYTIGFIPIETTAEAGTPGRTGFEIEGTDGSASVTGTDGVFQTLAGIETETGNPPTDPLTFLAFTFGQHYTIYSENNNDTTTTVDAMITKTDQADGSELITYTITNNTGTEKIVYIGSNAYLKVDGDTYYETFEGDHTGFSMTEYDDGGNDIVYRLQITPADAQSAFTTIWNGGDHPNGHTFEDHISTESGTRGNNIAYSWRVTVPAGTNKTETRSIIMSMLKKGLVPIPTPSGSSDSSSDDVPIEIVEDPNVTDIQVQLVSTQVGGALPSQELGTAAVPTKTLKLELSTISNAQFVSAVQDGIRNVPQGGAFVLDVDQVGCFNTGIIEILEQRRDIEVTVIFVNEGQRTKVVIPAGYNVRQLLDEKGYCGFLRLAGLLGSTPV